MTHRIKNLEGKSSIESSFFFDVNEISADVFDSPILNKTCFLSREYLASLQNSKIEGMSFFYYIVRSKNKPIGFYYFQLINLASHQLNEIINLDPYGKILNGLSSVLDKFIFGVKRNKPHYIAICGNMLLSGDYGFSVLDNKLESLSDAIATLKTELSKKGKVAAFIVKDFKVETDRVGDVLKNDGFNLIVMDPIMQMEIPSNWNTFEDYSNAMSAKYRLRTTNVRKKIEKLKLKEIALEELIKFKEEYDFLYKGVQQKSPIRLVHYNINYLISLLKNSNGKVFIKAYLNNFNKPVGFFCGIFDNGILEAHHIGIDYKLNKSHSLYQNILYDFINVAIELKAKTISFGRTSLEMKTTVGAIANNYNAYIRLENKIVNHLVKNFLPTTPPADWTPRNPFK